MSVQAASARRLDIGAVISDTFAVVRRNLKTFVLAALILVGIPNVIQIIVSLSTSVSAKIELPSPSATNAAMAFPQLSLLTIPLLIFVLVAFGCALSLQAGLFFAASKDLDGEPVEVKTLVWPAPSG